MFYSQNVKTALKLAHVRGVALLAIAEAGIALGEYSPLEVKVSVVGYGRAEKRQVQLMVRSLTGLGEAIESEDAADALAVAICHATTASHRHGGGAMSCPHAHAWRFPVLRTATVRKRTDAQDSTADAAAVHRGAPREVIRADRLHQVVSRLLARLRLHHGRTQRRGFLQGSRDDDDPEKFQLEPSSTEVMFDLAAQLDHFKQPLESGLKVANMGVKTFRWEDGDASSEQKFNYSIDENAKALHDWFEAITETERLFAELKRRARHDKLGVHDALIHVEAAWMMRRLIGAGQFLPLLDQIAKNEIYLHMARQRAADLGEAIRRGPGKSEQDESVESRFLRFS